MNSKLGRIIRIVFIVFMGMTGFMNLVGGIGTSCAAFFTKKYPPMWSLLDYQWLYQTFVVVTTLIGIAGIWATISLVRARKGSYNLSLIVLVLGCVIGAIHYFSSLALRGAATPANVVFFINVGTLVIALLFKIPKIREQVDLEKPAAKSDRLAAAGLASIVAGAVLLTVVYWAGPSHMYEGVNWVNVIFWPLNISGTLLAFGGFGLLVYARKLDALLEQKSAQAGVLTQVK
ncbi:MAG: hypothetical protein EHM41_02580 [Chloroflexi bacterium]|nr:MAG: hypothetical protein EHM41_02580 [Chloroflexota bacterium]